MNKKQFQKKWYYPLLQFLFWGSMILLMIPPLWAIIYEDDLPFMGFIFLIVIAIVYWIIKRIFYRIIFGDRILPKISK
jgi:hypothetical protein